MLRHHALTLTRIEQFVARLRDRIYEKQRVPLQLEVAGPVGRISYDEAQKLKYKPVKLGYSMGPVWSTFWFRVQGEIPKAWQGRRVDLLWSTHSEGLIWKDGVPFQGVNYDPYMAVHGALRPDAKLTDEARGGEKIALEIEVACNGPFGQNSSVDKYPTLSAYVLDQAELACVNLDAQDFYYDLLVPFQFLQLSYQEEQKFNPWTGYLLRVLNEICNSTELDKPASWSSARKQLRELYKHKNSTYWHELSAIGHAHIDTAWLWPLAETHRKCLRTFSTAVNYMKDYPEFRFSCSQAQQYDWVKRECPDLYARMKAAVKRGQWVPVGGTWIEPDCNVPCGEALVRQFLYGQRFFKSEFGRYCTEFWNPDVFGYSGALPQIMRGAGIQYFLTQKLSWNQFNKPMHQVFYWEGIDGSRVLTHFRQPIHTTQWIRQWCWSR